VVCAALAFGGSFTCNDSDDDNEPDVDTQRQVTDNAGGEQTLPRGD